MTGEKTLRVGSRKSELALIQTKHVISRLQKNFPHRKFEIHTMSTIGDRVLNISLPKIGEKSLFTRDLEEALRTGGVDFVVHSLKDLPTALPTGMAIGAILEREDARDALVLRTELNGYTIDTLPKGSVIGTSSLRRTAQIRRKYPHLQVCDIRGNLNTRLAKLDATDSKYAGIVLAQAGLVRMGWLQRISQVLEPVDLLYAVGQGALAVECRANDDEVLGMLRSLMCISTTCRILAERSFLKTLGGGCSAPVAVCSTLTDHVGNGLNTQRLSLTGAVWSLDGITQISDKLSSALLNMETNSYDDDVDAEQPRAKRARRSTHDTRIEGVVVEKKLLDEHENETMNDINNHNNNNDHNNSSSSNTSSSSQASSCEIINEDADLEQMAQHYNMQQLLDKHMNLAKQCPVVGVVAGAAEPENGHIINVKAAGDSVAAAVISAAEGDVQHCPLSIEVGQDFMGECPFVGKEEKIAVAASGKCPITGKAPTLQSTLKCPFSSNATKTTTNTTTTATTPTCTTLGHQGDGDNTANVKLAHAKCPFLHQTGKVQMFDYADEEKPQPSNRSHDTIPLTTGECIKLEDSLFCGLYAHACFNRDTFDCCHKLGQQLAEQLIKQGALHVMKCAQNEIHSKIQ